MDLRISEASVPWGIQNLVCRSLNEAINMFKRQVRSLENYLNVLDRIQEFCTVLEPVSPTYKDGKRIIALIENIWLSLEVSPDGSVRDLRLVGQYRQQNRQLEDMLKAWDHDADVVANVRKIINSLSGDVALAGTPAPVPNQVPMKVPDCAICFYPEFPGDNKVPRPCKNPKCGVYFHENCLYGSLTASRQFGVAFGLCPTCSVPVSCYKADN
ncbi:E3 ubiquitin-protein ligase FANCL isoform X2 [Epargyreus clarus]